MANYYYNRYNAVANTTTTYTSEGPWISSNMYNMSLRKETLLYPSYTFDSRGYNTYGTAVMVQYAPYSGLGLYMSSTNSSVLTQIDQSGIWWDSEDKTYSSMYQYRVANSTTNTTYSCGTLILSNIVATDGTYPYNGKHSDGYWYIRGGIVNVAPTLILATSSNQTIIESQSILLPNKNNFVLKITPNDVNASDTLQYSLLLRGSTVQAYTTCAKGTVIDYTIPYTSLLLGNNTVQVKVKDNNGTETIRNLVLRLKAPITLSQKSVKDALTAMGYPNASFGCLKDLKPASYPYSTISLAEIINSLS